MILDIIKVLVYVWALGEVASTAHLYFYAYQKGTKSVILQALFLFLMAVALTIAFRLLYTYTTYVIGDHPAIMRHFLIVPNLFLIATARYFRHVSTKLDK